MQSALRLIYPPQCMACEDIVMSEGGLCGACWVDARFIQGTVCLQCGTPLMGEAPGDEAARCDDCMRIERPWKTGGSVVTYEGTGRRLVMALKHGDRQDLVGPMAGWMAGRVRFAPLPDDVVVPVPIHRWRLLKRRFNQSALLARGIARLRGSVFLPDALMRVRATPPQEGMGAAARFALQNGAMAPHPRRGAQIAGRRVLLVDDVMTSGATLASTAAAAWKAGAARVDVVTFARVAKDR